MRLLETLTRPKVILFTFISMVIIGASFGYLQRFVGGEVLDMSMNGPDALKRLGEMNESQKWAHTLITLLADSLYPIAYGSFFAGATVKLAGGSKRWLALPALFTVIADFCENTVQVLALNGQENFILAKSIFTPLKFSMFIFMSVTFLIVLLIALGRYIKRKTNTSDG